MESKPETPAQFTARMREKYKDALAHLENTGPSPLQEAFDDKLAILLGEPKKVIEQPKLKLLTEILKEFG